MSSYLELCKKARGIAGISGLGPTTVVDQTGILLRLVDAIQDAWLRIQTHPKDWKWMWRDDKTITTIASTREYVLTGIESVHRKTFKIYKTSLTETADVNRMVYIDFKEFRSRFGALQNEETDRPVYITRTAAGNFRVHPIPDDEYIILFEYQKTPQIMTANADVPEMPPRFHPLIIHECLKEFGGYDDAPEVQNTAAVLSGPLWNQLFWDQEYKDEDLKVVRPE